MAAVAAAGAGAAELAGPADAALAAEAALLVAAAHPGELAAGAEADRSAIPLTITDLDGRVRHYRPGLFMFVDRAPRRRQPSDDGCTRLLYYRELPALELDEGIAVVGEYALRRQTAVMGRARVRTP